MSLDWTAIQIQALSATKEPYIPQIVTFNPRPPGMPQPGSATSAVLDVLKANPLRWFTHAELSHHINRNRAEAERFSSVAVDWALIRLRGWKWIERTADQDRNGRYMRYRLAPATPANEVKE